MIARHLGEERVHSRWRPRAATSAVSEDWDPDDLGSSYPERIEPELVDDRPDASRRWLVLIGIAVVIVIAVVASQHRGRRSQDAGSPSTPRQWVAQWSAASLDDPALVCQHLFAPALAAAFKADTGRTCLAYYASVRSSSFRIRHVFEDGPTAAVEAQQLGHGRRWGYFTVILSHIDGGWQAVDVVPGGLVRPR